MVQRDRWPAGDRVRHGQRLGRRGEPGADYTETTTTLTFADNEIFKEFIIPIVDDDIAEPDETINIQLSNPQGGATLGTFQTAVLVIQKRRGRPTS